MVANSTALGDGQPDSAREFTKSNKDLTGHKLLILLQKPPPQEYVERLRKDHPGLKIVHHEMDWFENKPRDNFPEEEWKDVTLMLASGNALPTVGQVPKMEYIQLMSAGANHIMDNPLYKDTEIAFCTANGVHGPQISEWVIGTWLAFQHNFLFYYDRQREQKWKRDGGNVDDAIGRRIGILGYGSIGRQVARVGKAMGCEIYAYNLHPRNTPESRRDETYAPPGTGDPEGKFPSKWFSGASKDDLHAFLGSGLDMLVIALPLTDQTTHLISAPEFKILSEKKTFVSNIGRGPIIHTPDLIEALNNDLIRGAALDVTDPEPLPDGHELWKAKNVIITPHVSGQSSSYINRLLAILEYNLMRYSEGKELTNKVNRKEGY